MLLTLLLACAGPAHSPEVVSATPSLPAPAPAAPARADLQAPRADDATLARTLRATVAGAPTAADHYAYAAVLARLRGAGRTCEFDAYPGVVFDHLEAALRAEPTLSAKAEADESFRTVRPFVRFQVATGADLGKPAVLAAVLVMPTFYGPRGGAYANPSTLRFAADGSATRAETVLGDHGPQTTTRAATWRLDGTTILLAETSGAPEAWTLSPTGELRSAKGRSWTDIPSECGA